MMPLNSMKELLVSELRDLYSAEKQLVQALPKMAKKASSPALKQAILDHLEETRTHVTRIEDACKELDAKPTGKKCKGMEGLVEEGKEMMEEEGEEAVRDAGLITAAQRVEHYEMAAYGCAITFAKELGESRVAKLLTQTLEEEEAADKKLTEIAEGEVNEAAMAVVGAEDEE
jgi:ferritin-like metal-binding protein YciE